MDLVVHIMNLEFLGANQLGIFQQAVRKYGSGVWEGDAWASCSYANWRKCSERPHPAGQDEIQATAVLRVPRDGGATEGNWEKSGAWSHGNQGVVSTWLGKTQTSPSEAPGTAAKIRFPKKSLAWPLGGHVWPRNSHFSWIMMSDCFRSFVYPFILSFLFLPVIFVESLLLPW